MIPKNNEIYRHFKGNLYKVITIAIHSETEEQMVVYQGLYGDFPVYCRPLSMFVSEVDHDKYPEVTQKFRFEPVNELISTDMSVNGEKTIISKPVVESVETDMTNMSEDNNFSEKDDLAEVDPLILEFLDAESILERKNIVAALHHKITDEMINTLAVVLDVVIEEGELEDRYQQLKTCLDTIEKYEIERK